MNGRRFRPVWPLTGNGFFYGRVGSGKSYKLKTFCEHYYEKRCKIWDMFGGKRGEGPFWAFPTNEIKLWRDYEQFVGMMKGYGPKEYPVNLVYPFFIDELPNELPEKKPRISNKAMTIYFKDVTISDISLVIGSVAQNAKYTWNYICKNLPDKANGQDILNLMNGKLKRYKDLTLYKSFILPLCSQKVLAGKNCPHNIDLAAESKKRDEIFVLCDDFVPKEFKLFIMGFILRKLFYEIIMKDKTHKFNIALFREMSLFMKVIDASSQDAEQVQNFRNLIVDIARYARSGLYIFGDTQSPNEVKGMISGSEDILCISEMPSQADRDAACESLRRDMRISPGQIAYIATMPVYEMVVVERGKKAVLIRRVQPPRSRSWKQNDVNFLSCWKKVYNQYSSMVPIKDYMQQIYSEANSTADEEVVDEEITESEDELEFRNENTDDFNSMSKKVDTIDAREQSVLKLVKNEPETFKRDKTGVAVIDETEKTSLKTSENIYNKPKLSKKEKETMKNEENDEKMNRMMGI